MKYEPKTCERCGILFECKPENISACHCSQIALTDEERGFMKTKYEDCLCTDCLSALKKEYAEMPLFYIENGYYVMSVKHHLRRGYCCKNGCRHCPYHFRPTANPLSK